jgi:hypothetical protein
MRALFGIVVFGACCCQLKAAETDSRWWPFGQKKEAELQVSPPSVAATQSQAAPSQPMQQQSPGSEYATAGVPEPERRWMFESPLAKVSWPRIHMPEMSKPKLPPSPFPSREDLDRARNSWVEKSPDPAKPSPLQAVKQGASRVAQSTRNAWGKTVDALTPGERERGPSSRIARRDDRPLWKRMFFVEPIEPQGPQTVTEWMAQERVDP